MKLEIILDEEQRANINKEVLQIVKASIKNIVRNELSLEIKTFITTEVQRVIKAYGEDTKYGASPIQDMIRKAVGELVSNKVNAQINKKEISDPLFEAISTELGNQIVARINDENITRIVDDTIKVMVNQKIKDLLKD